MKNEYSVDGDTATIFITMKDGTKVNATIDAEDIPVVSGYRWHAARQGDSFRIVCHMRTEPKGKKQAFYLHRVVMNAADTNSFIDHINCDPTDNRKSNLRVSDHTTNGHNRLKLHPTNTSGYRNVCWSKKYKLWQAMIKAHGRNVFLGYYKTALEASKAAIEGRVKYMPTSQEAMG